MKYFLLFILYILSLTAHSQQTAIDSIKQLLPFQNPMEKIQSLNELSWHYKNFDLDSSIILAKKALEISENEGSRAAISQSLNSLASCYESRGAFDSALILQQQVLAIKESLNDSLGMASVLNNMGIVYDQVGQNTKSLECYFRALRLYESFSEDPFEVAMVLGNIGIVYKKQNAYKKVLEYYQKALAIYNEVGSVFGQTVTKGNIGSVLLLVQNYEASIRYSNEALEGYKELGYERYIPHVQVNLGLSYDSLGQITKARRLYEEAIILHEEHDNHFELTNTHVILAANYYKTNEFSEGIKNAKIGLEYAQKINAKGLEVSALFELARNLAGTGDFEQGFAVLLKHRVARDTLFEETKTKQIYELQTKYETEKKEQQIALQTAEIEEQRAQNQRNLLAIGGLVFTVALLTIIILLIRSRARKKQALLQQDAEINLREAQLNAAISSQEKERSRFAKDLHDGFGQLISVLNLNLKSLEENKRDRYEIFEESGKVLEEMYRELKGICFNLMPQTLIQYGVTAAIDEFAARVSATGKVAVETDFFGLEERLSEVQEISIYRITQEWVNNVLKYSDAAKITIQLTKDEEELTLLIEDNGLGFDPALLRLGKGNGWKNMNSRANLIKGGLELDTTPEMKGNTLIVNAPVSQSIQENINQETF